MAGRFTDIVDIVAPSSAAQGKRVDVTVRVENIDTVAHLISCVAIVNGLRFIDQFAPIPSGGTHSFSGSFFMAGGDVTISAYTYYPVGAEWILDDQAEKDVALAEVFEGSITKKELDYEESWQAFPLHNIPIGTRTRVRITGRNDMASLQKLGMWWQVKDPDGVVVDEYSNWETYFTRSGGEQEFRGGSFGLDKEGTYTIAIQLFMNPADEVVVDNYFGNFCTVAPAVLEPEFAGFGITEYTKR